MSSRTVTGRRSSRTPRSRAGRGAASWSSCPPSAPTPAGEGKTTTSIGLAQGLPRIGVHSAVALQPQKYRLPCQTLLMINTYHYLYWGCMYCPTHWPDHDYLLRTLASMCTDRMLLMSPLEGSECPSDIAERAREHPDWAEQYTTSRFFEIARRYFDISLETYLGIRPLYLMKKKS